MAAPRGRGALPRPPPLSHPNARGEAHARAAPAVGAEPLLLPDANPDQRRDHRLQVGGPCVPPYVDTPYPRSRRASRRRRRARAMAAPGARRGPRPRRGRELPLGATGRALRLRRLRGPGAQPHAARGGGVLAHRVLRPRYHEQARPRLGKALPLGESRDARVFPRAGDARERGFEGGDRVRGTARDQLRAAGALRRGADPQDRDPVAAARLRLRCVHRSGLGTGRPTVISADTKPRIASKARLRFDRRDNRYMLLYPEKGLVLNPTAAEIAKLCTGEHSVAGIVSQLASRYGKGAAEIEGEVMKFLSALAERGLLQETE